MSSRESDQSLVETLYESYPNKIVPSFGFHPWFAYLITLSPTSTRPHEHYSSVLKPTPPETFTSQLPRPVPLCELIKATKLRLESHPNALVGEIGLDKSVRIPHPTDRNPETDRGSLTKYHICPEHQKIIVKTQLLLAAELERPVSLHCVKAHGDLISIFQELWKGHELLSRSKLRRKESQRLMTHPDDVSDDDKNDEGCVPFPRRICLHSYSGSVEQLREWLHPSVPSEVYISFSYVINSRTSKWSEMIKTVPDNRILVESDLHEPGERLDELMEEVVMFISKCKEWSLVQTVERLDRNWRAFVYGIQQDMEAQEGNE
jgi:Tat protein secretion system quality control protein TatD with DNase activity